MTTHENQSGFNKFTKDIVRSEAFIQERSKDPANIPRAVRMAALSLAETTGKPPIEVLELRVIGNIPTFAEGQRALNAIRQKENQTGRKAPFSQKEPHLLKVIEFNHAIKALIDRDHNITFHQLLAGITEEYAKSHSNQLDRDVSWFQQEARSALDGMRHELAYERVLGELSKNGVEYEETTKKDEMKGIDYFVTINGQRIGIDVKASTFSRDEAQKKSYHPERIVWSGFEWDDFEGGFHVSQDMARKKADNVFADLQIARHAA